MTRGDLAEWEASNGRLPDGSCVAMNSGWARYAGTGKFAGRDAAGVMHFPGVHPEAAEWLLKERSVSGLAVDTLSLDHGPSREFKTHSVWLPAGRWGIENIANLDIVPPAGATLVVGVPKVKGASGAPARVFALVAGKTKCGRALRPARRCSTPHTPEQRHRAPWIVDYDAALARALI